MEEIISIHLGQAGCQMGNALWELLRTEHCLDLNGEFLPGTDCDNDMAAQVLFSESLRSQWVPRCLFIDTDETVVDSVRTGMHKKLHDPRNLISGQEDAASCWARGRYHVGKQIIDGAVERFRLQVERCDSLQSIMLYNSVGGGTGSGVNTLFREYIDDLLHPGKIKVAGFNIYPSATLSTSTVEPYNAVIATSTTILQNDLNLIFDNEQLYRICQNLLKVDTPNYGEINQLIAQVSSSLTASSRFDGVLKLDIPELMTNLIPFPRLNSLIASLAPYQPRKDGQPTSAVEMTMNCFHDSYLMTECFLTRGPLLASSLLYRGNIHAREINQALRNYHFVRSHKRAFIDWVPNMFKVGLVHQPRVAVENSIIPASDRSLTTLINGTAVFDTFYRSIRHVKQMYAAKFAFSHWFTKYGMESFFIEECMNDLWLLGHEYSQIGYVASECDGEPMYKKPEPVVEPEIEIPETQAKA